MDITDCLILESLLKENNFTHTAEKLYISQPALTYRIKTLENELNTKLFIRTNKGIFFTDQGNVVAKYANKFLKDYADMINELKSLEGQTCGRVYIASSAAVLRDVMGDLICLFKDKYPLVDLYINAHKSTKAVEKLINDEVQIAIVRGNHDVNCKKILLNSKPIILVSKEEIDIKDLPKLPYIKYDADISMEQEISKWWRDYYNVPPNTIMHLNDTIACRKMVASGLGYSILPTSDVTLSGTKSLKLHEISLTKKNGELVIRSAWLMYKEYAEKLAAAKAFIEFVKDYYSKIN